MNQDIFKLAKDKGADVVGFASVERFHDAPEDTHPSFYMKETTGVISIGVRLLKGITEVWGDYTQTGKSISPYLFYGYGLINMEMSRIVLSLAKSLEAEGFKSLVFPPTWKTSMYRKFEGLLEGKMDADFSHRHAAVAAGLGEFGLNGLCLDSEAGPRIRFNSVITNAPLEASPLYEGGKVCMPEKCNYKCIRTCPAGAFSEEMRSCKIGDKSFEYATLDTIRCFYGITAKVKGSGGRSEITIPEGSGEISNWLMSEEEVNPVDRAMLNDCFGIICGDFCGRCLHQCPAPFVK